MKIQIICDDTPCRLVNNYRRFEESWRLRGPGLLEESRFLESACGGARIYSNDGKYLEYKLCNNPGGSNLQNTALRTWNRPRTYPNISIFTSDSTSVCDNLYLKEIIFDTEDDGWVSNRNADIHVEDHAVSDTYSYLQVIRGPRSQRRESIYLVTNSLPRATFCWRNVK
jgi:hypothetical protein